MAADETDAEVIASSLDQTERFEAIFDRHAAERSPLSAPPSRRAPRRRADSRDVRDGRSCRQRTRLGRDSICVWAGMLAVFDAQAVVSCSGRAARDSRWFVTGEVAVGLSAMQCAATLVRFVISWGR